MCVCSASDNIPKADDIRTLVKDIWDTRVAKLRLSADSFISRMEAHAKVWRMVHGALGWHTRCFISQENSLKVDSPSICNHKEH